jgi:hypothetical protein
MLAWQSTNLLQITYPEDITGMPLNEQSLTILQTTSDDYSAFVQVFNLIRIFF